MDPLEAKEEKTNSGNDRGLGGKGVEVNLQWGQIAELWEPWQELSYPE